MNKPRRRKPRNAAARFGQRAVYGDLKVAITAETVIVRCRRPSVSRKRMPRSSPLVTYAHGRSTKIRRCGVDRQQSALGIGSPRADADDMHEQWHNNMASFMAAPGSAARARRSRRRASWRHNSGRRMSAPGRGSRCRRSVRAAAHRARLAPWRGWHGGRRWPADRSDECGGTRRAAHAEVNRRMNSSAGSIIVLCRVRPLAR